LIGFLLGRGRFGEVREAKVIKFDFAGRTVLVTGASQGIGLAIANAFHEAGAVVHITGTRASASDYEGDLSRFIYHRCRLEQPEERAVLAEIVTGLAVLVNNAGAAEEGEYELNVFRNVLEVNLVAVVDLCFRFHEQLKENRGAVVNIGSSASFIALHEYPAYTASKTGLRGFTRAVADRWAREGIRVNMIAPGFIETRMIDWTKEVDTKSILRSIPLRRWGRPEEVSVAVLFLASPDTSYITGQSLIVDGGLLLR
jgi:3-oxoacyl-[acyl-carrier protein] reductase